MYNVRVKRYLDTEQIQIFSESIREDFDDRKYDALTGEIWGTGKLIVNPFTNEFECVKNFNNDEYNLHKSYTRTKKKIYDIVRSNNWEWFFTLTFNPEKVDSFDYELVTKKLSNWFTVMKRSCPQMKYLVVPEQHESGRWHFHGLFSNVDNMKFVDSGHKDKKGRMIWNVGNYKLGFSTATRIDDVAKASSYLLKYVTKELCSVTKGKKRYWASRNVDLPVIETYYVGMSEKEILNCISEVNYIKTVHSAFSDVTYVESPIYTTNPDFSKRYRQNPGNQL